LNLKEIRSRISELLVKQQEIAQKGFDATNRSAFDKMQKEVDALEADAQRLEALESRNAHQASFQRSPRPSVGAGASTAQPVEERKANYNRAFQQFAIRGSVHAVDAELRDLLTTSDATGGALIPQDFMGVIIDAKKYYGPVADRVRQKITDNKGTPLKISFSNDTGNGLTLLGTEGSTSPSETDPTFVSKILGVDTVSGGLVKVSFQELEDSSFDLDAFLRQHFALRYGRGLEKAITLGVDSAGTTLPNQNSGGLLASATVGTTTTSLANGIGWDDLTAAYGALDPAYVNPNTAWMFNSTSRATLLGMKDGFGRPFWTPDPSADGPFDKLLGYDVVINQSMPNIGGANATPIAFGDLTQAYMLRTDGAPSILRLNERYADTLEVGFFLYSRIGGISLNAGIAPLVVIKQAAS